MPRHPVPVMKELYRVIEEKKEMTEELSKELLTLINESKFSAPEDERAWIKLAELMTKHFPGPADEEYQRVIQGDLNGY